jgi:sulfite oxidase
LQLSLAELSRQFGAHSVFVTLTCAGNRRSEHSRVKPVSGVQWQSQAIGNARWTGPRLSDVLRKAGPLPGASHVWFEGLDEVPHEGGIIPFGGSIPLAAAMGDSVAAPGVLLAHQMNDVPLPPDHGFPLRTVVPGYIGARSVKWLGKIIVNDRPSDNHFVATAYKLVTESTDEQWRAAPPLNEYVMNSVTCLPQAGARVKPGLATVRGFALAPGAGRRLVSRVDVSADGGASWVRARLDTPRQAHCWQLWTAGVPVTAATKSLLVRAVDDAGAMQPQTVDWNLKGYMFNGWHETPLQVES